MAEDRVTSVSSMDERITLQLMAGRPIILMETVPVIQTDVFHREVQAIMLIRVPDTPGSVSEGIYDKDVFGVFFGP
jgi:hypothetical protein